MKRRILALIAGLLLLAGNPVQAGKVKTWHHHRADDHEASRTSGVVLGSEGSLRLAHRLRPYGNLEASHVWAVVEDGNGNLYAGTGDEGKLYRLAADGRATIAYVSESSQILSLARSTNGESIYAGTGPEATIVQVDREGAKLLCALPESYVWAVAPTPNGNALYAATGPNGRIYHVTTEGKATVFFETKQDHVLSLAVAADGTVYAGTDKTGRIYRISPAGKGFVVHQTPQTEVRTLLLHDDVLYAGTSSLKTRTLAGREGESSGSKTASLESSSTSPPVRVVSREEAVPLATTTSTSKAKEATGGSRAPAPSAPTSGENSVYRITSDGSVRELFRGKVLIMSLARQGDRLLVATGMKGELFEINEQTREKITLARLDHGQLLALAPRGDGSLIVAAGDPGKLYVLEDRFVNSGTAISSVLDAKNPSHWGAMRWRADLPAKTTLTLATRSGNVAEPDETWSDWSSEQADGNSATITSPPARYLQYRATLSSGANHATPVLKSLVLRYANVNQPPELTRIEVPDLTASTRDDPKKMKFKWTATDPNEDELRYQIHVKKDGWTEWIVLEDDYEKTEFEWDTTTTPSGTYRLKIVAGDHPDNDDKSALECEKISEPFIVCHVPPTVSVKATGLENGRMTIEGSAQSSPARLVSASYALNGKKWLKAYPEDGLFDSRSESFRFETEELKPGAYVLVLKVRDAAGNVGSADVVFSVPARREPGK